MLRRPRKLRVYHPYVLDLPTSVVEVVYTGRWERRHWFRRWIPGGGVERWGLTTAEAKEMAFELAGPLEVGRPPDMAERQELRLLRDE